MAEKCANPPSDYVKITRDYFIDEVGIGKRNIVLSESGLYSEFRRVRTVLSNSYGTIDFTYGRKIISYSAKVEKPRKYSNMQSSNENGKSLASRVFCCGCRTTESPSFAGNRTRYVARCTSFFRVGSISLHFCAVRDFAKTTRHSHTASITHYYFNTLSAFLACLR